MMRNHCLCFWIETSFDKTAEVVSSHNHTGNGCSIFAELVPTMPYSKKELTPLSNTTMRRWSDQANILKFN